MNNESKRKSVVSLLKLACPVIASQAMGMMVNFADTMMVGRLGDEALGAVAFSSNLIVPVMFFGIGVVAASTPIIGRRMGRGDHGSTERMIYYARRVNKMVLCVMMLAMAILWLSIPLMGQPAEVTKTSITYVGILWASLIGQQMYAGGKSIMEGLQDTATPMRIGVTCNVINIIGNQILIFGIMGWEGIGVYGAGVSSLISRMLMWAMMEYALRQKLRKMGIEPRREKGGHLTHKLFMTGLPLGGQSVVECMGFTVCGIMMGWLGTEVLAAHQVVNMYTSLTYLMTGGIATAVTIKVSVSMGQNDRVAARRYALSGLCTSGGFMLLMAATFCLMRHTLPGLIIDSREALEVAASLFLVGAMFQLFDGVQVTAIGALRGYGDLTYPAVVSGIAFAATGIPVSYLMGFVVGLGGVGVWMGLCAGLMVASALLLKRLKPHVKAD